MYIQMEDLERTLASQSFDMIVMQLEMPLEIVYRLCELGACGAYLYGQDEKRVIPGFEVKAIDTTAAGDTFGAAFCVEYCLGKGMEDSIRYAHAAAALCVTRKGGQISIPNREETEAFYKERN